MVGSWVKLIWSSLGAAAIAAAAQIGVAEAVGIVRWGDPFPANNADAWNAQLSWIAFIYAVAVFGGASVGRRALRRPNGSDRTGARMTAAISAAIGAAAATAVAWLPARAAAPPVNVDPGLVVTITAGAAIVVGFVVTLFAVYSAPAAAGVQAAVAWIWLVGIGSAAAGISTRRPYDAPRLAVVDAPSLVPIAWWSGPNLMIAVAGVLGLIVALVARRRRARRAGIALSGLVGPSVVAAAYLIAGPGSQVGRSYPSEPYTAALIAAGVGLLASAIVAISAGRDVTTAPVRGRSRPNSSGSPYLAGDDEPIIGEIVDAPAVPRRATVSQSARSFDEDYSDWLRDLGHAPGERANS